jgi:DNA-binding XRE family transcriptional regulator
MALLLKGVQGGPGRPWHNLRQECGEREDLPKARDRLQALGLIHSRPRPGFDARHRAIVWDGWYPGPKPEEDPEAPISGEELGRVRRAAGVLQGTLAQQLGVSGPTLSGWERGRHSVPAAYWPEIRAFMRNSN